jgi:hypothetical protein
MKSSKTAKAEFLPYYQQKPRKNFLWQNKSFNNVGPDLKLPKRDCLTSQLNLNWSLIPRSIFLMLDDLKNVEFYMNNLNMSKCDVRLESQMVDSHLKQGHTTFVCQRCLNRNNPMQFLKNNLHPVWFKVSKNGKFTRD